MERFFHRLSELFSQLGLPSDERGIQNFLMTHFPLDPHTPLTEAHFWSIEQANLLQEKILEDADWVALIDQLDTALRVPYTTH
jgi:hypothetical protein